MTSISGENALQKVHAGSKACWPISVSSDNREVTISFSIVTGPDDSAPDWEVILCDSPSPNDEIWASYGSAKDVRVDITGPSKDLYLFVECPRGARYGDTVSVTVYADQIDSKEFKAVATQSVMILKTQIDQEKTVALDLYKMYREKAVGGGAGEVYAVLNPMGLRGYVFVEGMNTNHLNDEVRDVKKAKGFVKDNSKTSRNVDDRNSQTNGEISMEEISPYLVEVSAVVGIVEGDIVELVNGPFKGEKARVIQIDQGKEEIKVELIEAMIPIPVTVKGDSVRIVEKER